MMNTFLIQDGAQPAGREYPNAYAALPISSQGVVCSHTGLRHAHLAKLLKPGGLAAPHVRVVFLREPGARHGKTLFHMGDILRWLDSLAAHPVIPPPAPRNHAQARPASVP